jgi:redox-sensitive bicupin YhaK (pirin superfamily)
VSYAGSNHKWSFSPVPWRNAWVHVAEGELQINGMMLHAGDAATLSEESKLALTGKGKAQVLLFDLK